MQFFLVHRICHNYLSQLDDMGDYNRWDKIFYIPPTLTLTHIKIMTKIITNLC